MENLIKSFVLSALFITQSVYANCEQKVDLKEIGSKTPAYECKDGTVSFEQNLRYSSRKAKKDDYESLCGAVAAANVFHAYCKKLFVNPVKIASKYFSDYTPGIRPDTLEYGLNKMFENNDECLRGRWHYYYSTNRWAFFNSLYYEVRRGEGNWNRKLESGRVEKRSPVIVLIAKSEDADILHYVTVVDIIGYDPAKENYKNKKCKVIYNDFGGQSSVSCSRFADWSNNPDNNTFTGWMPEYIHIVFKRSAFTKAVEQLGAKAASRISIKKFKPRK